MSRDLNTQEQAILEGYIDSCGLQAVLEALSTICGEKAEHVLASYSDTVLAKRWQVAEGVIGCALTNREISAISR